MKLTPAQERISTGWPIHTFHAVKIKSYRESRVAFEAAKKLGLRASWSGDLMILRPARTDSVVDASVERILRGLNSYVKGWGEEEKNERREFLRRWCPISLPAFDLIRHKAYV